MSTPEQEQKVPTTKEELIAMLKQQLEKVEDEITQMQGTLEQERDKRKDLNQQLNEKQEKIQQLIENESKTLGDKVNEGLYNTLEAANKMRAEAESEKRQLTEDNIILNQKITHRDSKVIDDRQQIRLNEKKVGALEQKLSDLRRKQQNLKDKKVEMQGKTEQMKKEHERIEREEFELRNHLENMKKLKLYLNKQLEQGLRNISNSSGVGGGQKSRVRQQNDEDNFWG